MALFWPAKYNVPLSMRQDAACESACNRDVSKAPMSALRRFVARLMMFNALAPASYWALNKRVPHLPITAPFWASNFM